MLPLALALMAAGAASSGYGDKRVEKSMSGALNDGMNTQRALQGQIAGEVVGNARSIYDPSLWAQRYEQAATDRGMMLGEGMAGVDAAPAVDADGQVSKDYLVARAGRTAAQADAIAKLTRLMARSGARDTLHTRDSLTNLESADRIAAIQQRMKEERDLMDQRLQHASHAGDNQKLLGQFLNLAGMMTGKAPAGGAAAASAAPSWQNTGMFIFPGG